MATDPDLYRPQTMDLSRAMRHDLGYVSGEQPNAVGQPVMFPEAVSPDDFIAMAGFALSDVCAALYEYPDDSAPREPWFPPVFDRYASRPWYSSKINELAIPVAPPGYSQQDTSVALLPIAADGSVAPIYPEPGSLLDRFLGYFDDDRNNMTGHYTSPAGEIAGVLPVNVTFSGDLPTAHYPNTGVYTNWQMGIGTGHELDAFDSTAMREALVLALETRLDPERWLSS